MKTIAQQIKWNFETNDELEIKDKNGNQIYFEDSNGFWTKREYDSKGNEIYFEDSEGFWVKREYDSEGILIYFENSDGEIEENRPYPKSIEIDGIKYKLTKL
jgi:hypothetical protein